MTPYDWEACDENEEKCRHGSYHDTKEKDYESKT